MTHIRLITYNIAISDIRFVNADYTDIAGVRIGAGYPEQENYRGEDVMKVGRYENKTFWILRPGLGR